MSAQQAFLTACAEGNLEQAQQLLPQVESVNVKTEQGWSGLTMACHGEHQELAKWLIAQGADVNATNPKGTTVFMYAKTPVVNSGDFAFLDYLIGQGADPHAKDCFDKTALDYVAEKHPGNPLIDYLSNLK